MKLSCWPLIILLCACSGSQPKTDVATPPAAKSSERSQDIVVSYHPIATQIGYNILKKGGNAADAFVAATAAEIVLGEGVTSFGGPLGALVYNTKDKSLEYVNAGFNQPLDPRQTTNPEKAGDAFLVPGAPAGLEAISQKYGKLSLKEALQPAIELAENGFEVNALYAALIGNKAELLKQSEYGAKTFFKDGKPLAKGDTLRLPLLAKFLKKFASLGSLYVYKGNWAHETTRLVNSRGGHISDKDFSSYKAEWRKPFTANYRGYDIFSSNTDGGLNALTSLKLFEQVNNPAFFSKHFSESAQAIDLMTRMQSRVFLETGPKDTPKLSDEKTRCLAALG